MKKLNQRGFSAVEGLLIVLALLLAGGIGYYVWHSQKKPTASTTTTASPVKSSSSSSTAVGEGTITGDVSFPGSGIPSDEQACAVNTTDASKVYCDKVGERQPTNSCAMGMLDCTPPKSVTKYSIKVPAGDYYVYATSEAKKPGYKAYYNEFSKCGNDVKCAAAGHMQYIKVTVAANATAEGVDPTDWYAQ